MATVPFATIMVSSVPAWISCATDVPEVTLRSASTGSIKCVMIFFIGLTWLGWFTGYVDPPATGSEGTGIDLVRQFRCGRCCFGSSRRKSTRSGCDYGTELPDLARTAVVSPLFTKPSIFTSERKLVASVA